MTNKWLLGAITVGTLVAVTLVGFGLLRPKTLDGTASAVVKAFLENDPETVYAHGHECQKDLLPRDKFVAAWREIVEPVLRSYKPVGPPKIDVSPAGLQGTATVILRNEKGMEIDFYVITEPTDDGPAYDLLAPFLAVWRIRAAEQGTEDLSSTNTFAMGLSADAPTLRRLGINGLPSANPDRGLIPLDDWIAFLHKMAQEASTERGTER